MRSATLNSFARQQVISAGYSGLCCRLPTPFFLLAWRQCGAIISLLLLMFIIANKQVGLANEPERRNTFNNDSRPTFGKATNLFFDVPSTKTPLQRPRQLICFLTYLWKSLLQRTPRLTFLFSYIFLMYLWKACYKPLLTCLCCCCFWTYLWKSMLQRTPRLACFWLTFEKACCKITPRLI